MHREFSEQEIVRRESLQKLLELGINPYPPELFPVSHLSTMIKENFESIKSFWPSDAPDIKNIPKYINKYKLEIIGSIIEKSISCCNNFCSTKYLPSFFSFIK